MVNLSESKPESIRIMKPPQTKEIAQTQTEMGFLKLQKDYLIPDPVQ